MQKYDSEPGSSSTDSGTDLRKFKRGTYVDTVGQDGIPPPPQDRTKYLSYLPLSKIHSVTRSTRTKDRTKDRTKSYSISSATPPSTLVKLLQAQESTTKETQALLNAALSQLDAASARAAKAEAEINNRRVSAILSHAKLTETAARAEESVAQARREAEAYKMQLQIRDEQVRTEQERVRAEEQMRAEAEREAERARGLARKWREEGRIMKAKEDGRRLGYGEGLQRGRLAIAAAVTQKESHDGQRLVGDGAAYIEEYDEEPSDNRTRRDRSRRDRSRRRKNEPASRHTSTVAHTSTANHRQETYSPRRERVNSSAGRQESRALVQEYPPPPPEPEPEQAVILRRARSIQTDPSVFMSERMSGRTRSQATSSSSAASRVPSPPPPPPQIYVEHSPPPVHPAPYSDETYSSPLPQSTRRSASISVKSESFSPHIPNGQSDPNPIPIPTPISQVPFAPGIVPGSYAEYPQPSEPLEPQPSYFPMPAPPANVVFTSTEDRDRDVQTPSTMSNDNNSGSQYDILHRLRGFPAVASRAGSTTSGGSVGRGMGAGAGGFDLDLSTIHEHSREGTTVGGEEYDRGALSPGRSRNVEQWRRSLEDTPSQTGSDLLRPPSRSSNNSNSRRRPPPRSLNLGSSLDRQLSSGSTSTQSININVEPPSNTTSPTRQTRGYADSHQPMNNAYLSPLDAPRTLSADDNPVIPDILEEDEEDEEDVEDYSPNFNYSMRDTRDFPPIPIVDALPPGFVPTPNGTRIVQLQRDGQGFGPIAGAGSVMGNGNRRRQQNGNGNVYQGYGGGYYNEERSRSSSSRSSSVSGSSSGTELARPAKYRRSGTPRYDRGLDLGLTSTFPPSMMDEMNGMNGSSSGGSGAETPMGNTFGGIYSMPPVRSSMKHGGSRMAGAGVPMPTASMPQYGVASMPEPSVPQYDANAPPANNRYVNPFTGTVPMPEPANLQSQYRPDSQPQYPSVSQYPSASQSQYPPVSQSQYSVSQSQYPYPTVSQSQYPSVSQTQYPAQYPSVSQAQTQYPYVSQTQYPPVQSQYPSVPNEPQQTSSSRRSLRRTKGSISMPEPGVPQYAVAPAPAPPNPTQGYHPTPGGSTMTAPAVQMPHPTVTEYSSQEPSRITAPAVPMPEASVPQYDTTTPGAVASTMTAPAVHMPEASVPHYDTTTPGGTASRITAPVVPMPEASVSSYATPGGGASRLTAPVVPMPEASVSQYETMTPGGGSSRMTPAVVSMPEVSVPQYETVTTGGGASRVTAPAVPMPEASVPQYGTTTPSSTRASRITSAAVSMPEASVPQYGTTTPGSASRVTVPVIPMPEASVPPYGTATPGGGASRVTAPAVSMPEASVPQYGTTTPGGGAVSMPEPSVPSYSHTTPGGGSRMTEPVLPMPEPTIGPETSMSGSFTPGSRSANISMPEPSVPSYDSQQPPTPAGGSRVTAPSLPMPEPTVPQITNSKPLSKAQKKAQKKGQKKGTVSMPEPEIPTFGEEPAETSRIVPPTIPMPEPSSSVTAPAVSMPVPSIGTPSIGNVIPPSSPSMSAWGMGTGTGTPSAWGSGADRRTSLHAGTTPVTMPEPLPVPGPHASMLRKNMGSFGSPASSIDSTTRRNTEANKGSSRTAHTRGMTSAWGAG